MCQGTPVWKHQINCLDRGHTLQLNLGLMPGAQDPLLLLEYLKHAASHLWHEIFPVATTSSCFERKSVFGELCLGEKNRLVFTNTKYHKICKLVLSVSTFGPTLFFRVHCPFYTKLNTSHMQLETKQIMNVRIRWHFFQHLFFWKKKHFAETVQNGVVLHRLALNH